MSDISMWILDVLMCSNRDDVMSNISSKVSNSSGCQQFHWSTGIATKSKCGGGQEQEQQQ